MNHTEAVVAERVSDYETLLRIIQQSQRQLADAKEADDSSRYPRDEYHRRTAAYHETQHILELRLRKAMGLTEVDVEFRSYAALNRRGS